MSVGRITEKLTEINVLDVYAEGQFFPECILIRHRLQLVAEIAAIEQGCVEIEDIPEQGQLQTAHVEEFAGGGIILPGFRIGAHIQKDFQRQPGGQQVRGQGAVEIERCYPVFGPSLQTLEKVRAYLQPAV